MVKVLFQTTLSCKAATTMYFQFPRWGDVAGWLSEKGTVHQQSESVPWGFCWEATGDPQCFPCPLPWCRGSCEMSPSMSVLFTPVPWCWKGKADLPVRRDLAAPAACSSLELTPTPFPTWFYFLSDASQLHGKGSNTQQRKL